MQRWSLIQRFRIAPAGTAPSSSLASVQAPAGVALITKYSGYHHLVGFKPVSRWVCDGAGGCCTWLLAPFFIPVAGSHSVDSRRRDLITGDVGTALRTGLHGHALYLLLGVANIVVTG